MSNPNNGGGISDPFEVITLAVLAMLTGGTVVSLAMGWLNTAVRWLVAHGVLVDGPPLPLLVIPGTHGAGLDLPRVMVVAGMLLLLLLAAGNSIVRRHRRSQAEEQP